MIIDLQKYGTWKIHITITIDFISSKDIDEEQVMHSNSDNIEVTTYDKSNEVIEETFELLLSRYQVILETTMKGSIFMFGSVNLLYYKCHKINFKRGSSYNDSPEWIKTKKATINPKMMMINVFNTLQELL